jgi:hypothetical protein
MCIFTRGHRFRTRVTRNQDHKATGHEIQNQLLRILKPSEASRTLAGRNLPRVSLQRQRRSSNFVDTRSPALLSTLPAIMLQTYIAQLRHSSTTCLMPCSSRRPPPQPPLSQRSVAARDYVEPQLLLLALHWPLKVPRDNLALREAREAPIGIISVSDPSLSIRHTRSLAQAHVREPGESSTEAQKDKRANCTAVARGHEFPVIDLLIGLEQTWTMG